MKIISHILLAACLLVTSLSAMAQAKIQWLQTSYDFGAFQEDGGNVDCTFKYCNVGNEPLVIVSARASCGCTTPKYPKQELAPGDTAVLSVTYDPIGRPGRFEKKIYVETNAQPSRSTLEITGITIGSLESVSRRFPIDFGVLRLRQGTLMFGQIKKDKTQTVFLDGYNASEDTIQPLVLGHPEYIDATIVPEKVAPGEQMSFIFHMRSDRCPLYGIVNDTLQVVSDKNSDKKYSLPAIAVVNEDFSRLSEKQLANAPIAHLASENVDFGELNRNRPQTLTKKIEISNIGKSVLKIRRVYTADTGVTVAVDKEQIKPGKKAVITIVVDITKLPGALLNARISVVTNDPLAPTQTLKVTGVILQDCEQPEDDMESR